MKLYCTQGCIEKYFHDGDVFGLVWAKAISIEEEPVVFGDRKYNIFVSVEMETVKASSLYPETKTSFFVEFEKLEDGSFIIYRFVTG